MPLSRLSLLFIALLLLHPAVGIEKAGREGQYLLKGMVTTNIIKTWKLTEMGKSKQGSIQQGRAITEPHQATHTTTCQSQRQLRGPQHNQPPQDSHKEPDALSGNHSSTGRHQDPRTVILRKGRASTTWWHKTKVELDYIWGCLVGF